MIPLDEDGNKQSWAWLDYLRGKEWTKRLLDEWFARNVKEPLE